MSYPPEIYHGDTGEVSAHIVRAGTEPALEGTVTIYDGTAWTTCHAGDFAHVPAVGTHGVGDWDQDAYDRFMREHDNHWL